MAANEELLTHSTSWWCTRFATAAVASQATEVQIPADVDAVRITPNADVLVSHTGVDGDPVDADHLPVNADGTLPIFRLRDTGAWSIFIAPVAAAAADVTVDVIPRVT